MIATDQDALICDMAETYGIFDLQALPVATLATLAVGLRENSRILELLADNLPNMAESGIELALNLVDGIIACLPDVAGSAIEVCAEFLASAAEKLPDFLESGIELIGELIAGLISAIPDVISAAGEIIDEAKDAFSEIDWGEVGGNIVAGIANGITSGATAIWQAAKNAASSALSAAKRVLGIASPSKVMRDEIGKFIPAGIAVGIDENTNVIADAMDEMADVAMGSFKVDFDVAADLNEAEIQKVLYLDPWKSSGSDKSAASSVNITLNVYSSEGTDVDALAEKIMQKLQIELEKAEVKIA